MEEVVLAACFPYCCDVFELPLLGLQISFFGLSRGVSQLSSESGVLPPDGVLPPEGTFDCV